MIVDKLHGTLVAYEMRIEDEDMSRKEATFKVSSKQDGKNKSTKGKPICDDSDDEEITKFVRKLKRGTGKYKGKLALKCFHVEIYVILLLNVRMQRTQIVMNMEA